MMLPLQVAIALNRQWMWIVQSGKVLQLFFDGRDEARSDLAERCYHSSRAEAYYK